MQIIHTSVSLAIMHKIIKFCTLSHVAVSSDNIENHLALYRNPPCTVNIKLIRQITTEEHLRGDITLLFTLGIGAAWVLLLDDCLH